MKIDIACYGNHEFDFPLQHTTALARQCQFPWLLSNVKNIETKRNLGDGLEYFIMEKEGFVIGFIGLAGPDFKGRLISAYKNIVHYEDCIEKAKVLCETLRKKGCNLIIALTHMRIPADEALAKNVPQIDIILGGHDHIVFSKLINKIPVIKSGVNFQHIGIYKILKHNKQNKNITYQGRRWSFITQCIPILKKKNKYPQLEAYIAETVKQYKERGIAKPEKFKKEKTMLPEDFWKFHFTNLNGKVVIQLSSDQRSQIAFTKYVCFQRKMYFSKSLPKSNYNLSSQKCIASSIAHICSQIKTHKNEESSVIYSAGLHFIPYIVQTCNTIYLPNQLSCTIEQISHLHKIIGSATKNGINCYAFIDLMKQFREYRKQNRWKINPGIRFVDMPQEYIKLFQEKKVKNLYHVNLEFSNQKYCVKDRKDMVGRILLKLVCEGGKEYYVDYEDCFAFSKSMTADKLHDPSKLIQFKQYEKNYQIVQLADPRFLINFPRYNLFHLEFPKIVKSTLIPPRKTTPKKTTITIKSQNPHKLQYLNTWVSHRLSKEYVKLNLEKQGKQEYEGGLRYKALVFNENQISYPTYELGYGYLPVLFSRENGASNVLYAIDCKQFGEKKWFNLSQSHDQKSSKQHPVYKILELSEKNPKTTAIKNSKSNKTAEWVTKYAKTQYNQITFVNEEAILRIFKEFESHEKVGIAVEIS